jgi:hypothetical protein
MSKYNFFNKANITYFPRFFAFLFFVALGALARFAESKFTLAEILMISIFFVGCHNFFSFFLSFDLLANAVARGLS